MFKINIQPLNKDLEVKKGSNLFQTISGSGLLLTSLCGGQGTCNQCKIIASPIENLSPITQKEKQIFSKEEIAQGWRLACETKIMGDITLHLPNNQNITSSKKLNHIQDLSSFENIGLAIDIGTTTVGMYLCDLDSGSILNSEAFLNPQRNFGEDVITRIHFAENSNDNIHKLQEVLLDQINNSITKMISNDHLIREKISRVAVAGNTTMQVLFLGKDPASIGVIPFMPEDTSSAKLNANDLSLSINPDTEVYVFPTISGFIGGDALANILSSEMHKSDDVILLIDIGTNGELLLGNKDKIFATSCAMGPAFEGFHIECGMTASSGAICDVEIDPTDYSVKLDTIENTTPVGICGSGLIASISEMVLCKIIDNNGNLNCDIPNVISDENGIGRKFILHLDENGKEIYISLDNIRQVQLAKSALVTGINSLIKESGFDNFNNVLLTGSFGININTEHAFKINLLPKEIQDKKISSFVNGAGQGIINLLVNNNLISEVENLSNVVKSVNLAKTDNFFEEFISSMLFPEL